MFVLLIIKAIGWSPFLGMELYDTIFEQIYHDVNFQINVIKPANSRTASPLMKGSKTSADALVRPHQEGVLSSVQE